MTQPSSEEFAAFVAETAAAFEYPATPNVAAQVRRHPPTPQRRALVWRSALAVILLTLCLGITLTVPTARAALVEFLQIGAVRIGLLPNDQVAAPLALQAVSILDLGEEVSLKTASEIISPRPPGFPPALGRPAVAFAQNVRAREPVITYVWPQTEERPQITLTLIELPQFGMKWAAGEQIITTEVLDQEAIWIEGPHRLDLRDGRPGGPEIVATNVLIWTMGNVTYRLEGDIPLLQARQIAESWP
jgi:hypothetical protein